MDHSSKTVLYLCLAFWLGLTLSACGLGRVPDPLVATSPPPSVTTTPVRPTATPVPPPSATPLPVATWSAELAATVVSGLPATATPEQPGSAPVSGAIEGVQVLPVTTDDGRVLVWIAYTYGSRSFDPPQDHVVSIYERDGATWREVSRLTMAEPDYLDPQGVSVAWIGPDDVVWLVVQSGMGAHGSCFDLLRFEAQALQSAVANCNTSPLAGELRDLNGDQVSEVVINQSDNYIFCYACGVRLWQYQIFRRAATNLVEVQLAILPDSAPDDLRRTNNRAVELAQAGLWKDARETIDQIPPPMTDETVAWNAVLIRLHADARAEQVRNGGYPLLEHVFYGDYAAALDSMRAYSVAEIFARPTPLITSTVALGWEPQLNAWLLAATSSAIQARPDLAAAFFLRGWAVYLADPRDPAVLDNVRRAAQLNPAEPLFMQSLTFLEEQFAQPLP